MNNKHDANVKRNTLVNFQIGLITSLLAVYLLFQIPIKKTECSIPDSGGVPIEDSVFTIGEVLIEKPKKVEVSSKKKKVVVLPTEIRVTKDPDGEIDDLTKNLFPDSESGTTTSKKEPIFDDGLDLDEKIVYPISKLTFAPVFPGCEDLQNNEETIACFSSKVKRLVSKKFNGGLGAEYGLSGIQRIYVQFEIAKDGTVGAVKVRAPHKALEKEAQRIMKKFPTMKPGLRNDKPVRTLYQLPIVFQIQE